MHNNIVIVVPFAPNYLVLSFNHFWSPRSLWIIWQCLTLATPKDIFVIAFYFLKTYVKIHCSIVFNQAKVSLCQERGCVIKPLSHSPSFEMKFISEWFFLYKLWFLRFFHHFELSSSKAADLLIDFFFKKKIKTILIALIEISITLWRI